MVAQQALPSHILETEAGSLQWGLSMLPSHRKTESTLCNKIHRARCNSEGEPCAPPRKLSTKMSMAARGGCWTASGQGSRADGSETADWEDEALHSKTCAATGSGGAAANVSSWCGGRCSQVFSAWFALSATVSVAVEKAGGEFFHPMGRVNGNATRGLSPGGVGKVTANLAMPSKRSQMRQNPLKRSTLIMWTGPCRRSATTTRNLPQQHAK